MSEPEETLENMVLDFSAKDPVCGMVVDPPQARGKAKYQGDTYFFCSPGCMQKFMASPAKYLPTDPDGAASASAPATVPKKFDKDPVCGMRVDPAQAVSSAEFEHKLYHFCSRGCADKFQRDPRKYLSPAHRPAGMSSMVQIGGAAVAARTQEKDPVCGMSVDPAKAAATVIHGNKTYSFCSRGCGEKFKADPEKYLSSPSAASGTSGVPSAGGTPSSVASEGRKATDEKRASYVCPMDPEIRQDHPGACPKCGMALEPDIPMAAGKTQWTCPMHPEIVRDGPGVVSYLRHGAGADDHNRGGGREP